MRTRNLAVSLLWTIAAACGGGTSTSPANSNVNIGTAASTGSVGGVVLQAQPGLPAMVGAMVTVVAGDKSYTAMTDMNGAFGVAAVPSGVVIVKITAADHYDVYLTSAIASSAGNFPVNNAALSVGPIAMVGNKGSFSVRLVDEKGVAVQGAKVNAVARNAYLDLSGGGLTEKGVVEVTATSGMDGLVTLTGLPDYSTLGPLVAGKLTVEVPPIKVMGVETYQFLGLTADYFPLQLTGGAGQTQTPTIVLAGPHSPLQALSSNVDYIVTGQSGLVGSVVSESGPITISFNQAVLQGTLRAQLVGEQGQSVAVSVMPTVTSNLVTLAFTTPLSTGTRYNLVLHVDSLYPTQAKEFNVTAPFFTPAPTGAVMVSPISHIDAMPAMGAPADYILVFNQPIGVGGVTPVYAADGKTQIVGPRAPVPCVVYYDADLDGNSMMTSPGEWNSGGNNLLTCDNTQPPARPGIYLKPDEFANGVFPTSGFTTQWRLAVHSACAGVYLCSPGGKQVHLVFTRSTDPSFVVKRADGTIVGDITFMLPSF